MGDILDGRGGREGGEVWDGWGGGWERRERWESSMGKGARGKRRADESGSASTHHRGGTAGDAKQVPRSGQGDHSALLSGRPDETAKEGRLLGKTRLEFVLLFHRTRRII